MITILYFVTGTIIAFSIISISKSTGEKWLANIPTNLRLTLLALISFLIYLFFFHYLDQAFQEYFEEREIFEGVLKSFGVGIIVGLISILSNNLSSEKH